MNRESKLEDLRQAIYAAAELLPSQGPITAFAFLNPLQGMESLPFDEAMSRVKRIYGAEAYLEETRYFAKVQRGRITVEDLRTVIEEDLGSNAHQPIGGLCDRTELRLSLLANAIHCGVDRELDWLIAESQTLWRFRGDVSSSSKEAMIKTTMEWIGNSPAGSHYALQSLGALQSNKSRQPSWRSNQESTTLRLLWEIIRSEIGNCRFLKYDTVIYCAGRTTSIAINGSTSCSYGSARPTLTKASPTGDCLNAILVSFSLSAHIIGNR
jgi:uncharacterized protein